jgi:uncharacterized protein (TIGR03084 family)
MYPRPVSEEHRPWAKVQMPSRVTPADVLDDLVEEQRVLDEILSSVEDSCWDIPTPADGWSVRDQVSHLAFFEDAARLAMTQPDDFSEMARAALAAEGDPMEEHLRRGREMSVRELFTWWRTARASTADAVRSHPADARVLWFGPPMSLTSFISARLMETWAHGQDVSDALGVGREPTDRLRHVAHLGVRARSFSYMVRGLEPPGGEVRVELVAPSGDLWVWGDGEQAKPRVGEVRGSALDFCLVVTQRRNLDDTSLQMDGESAVQWMRIAQAFAGPPGEGREAEAARAGGSESA